MESGYCFESRQDIDTWLEHAASGPTFNWACRVAQTLHCWVCVGFPERHHNDAYNSLLTVSPEGRLHDVYRKHFLYATDESWAKEGEGFNSFEIQVGQRIVKMCTSICMDLNPKRFEAPFGAFELTRFAAASKVDILLCAMSWLASPDETTEGVMDTQTVYATKDDPIAVHRLLKYWLIRCAPLITLQDHKTVFVACNRVGRERNTVFAGSSCAFTPSDYGRAMFEQDGDDEHVLEFPSECHANNVDETVLFVNVPLPTPS
ncbi:Protein N-terminal amidase [Microbotryomycetes sp. JL221]|nr:Protein N-terminal amidase [Microbotryomycetes sp. JL221]